jgi:hypothetical protein
MSELKICKCCGTPIAEDEQQFNFMHDDFHICINVFQKRIAALESQLESLTPGGSEFHGSAQHCIEWIKDRLSTTGKIAAERNMLESQLAAANEDAKTLKAYSDHDGNCGINYGQDCCTCGYHVAVLRYESRIQEAQG